MIDFTNIKAITIPEGNVTKITCDDEILWEIPTINRLPNLYQEVEWIQNSGNAYIDLGFPFDTKAKVEMSQYIDSLETGYVFGAMENSLGLRCILTSPEAGNEKFFLYGSDGRNPIDINPTLATGKFNQFTFIWEPGRLFANNLTTADTETNLNQGEFAMTKNLYLFSQNNNGTARFSGNIRISYFKYYDKNDELICNLVPCYRRSDNVVGMYDLVRKVFLMNSGSGSFIKGTDVNLRKDSVDILYNLTNTTLSNTQTKINPTETYTTTISTVNGYKPIVSVIMDGVDITNSAYDGNVTITIPEVAGYIIITVSETIVNLLPSATDTDRKTIFNGIGYKSGMRLSISGGGAVNFTGTPTMYTTGFMPAKVGDTVYISGIQHLQINHSFVMAFNSSNAITGQIALNSYGGGCAIKLDSATFGSDFNAIRICASVIDANTIVTINQEIPLLFNLLPSATDTDRITIYNGIGYYNGMRWSVANNEVVTGDSTTSMTGFIQSYPAQTLRVYNYTKKTDTEFYIITFDNNKNVIKCVPQTGVAPSGVYESPGYFEVYLAEHQYGKAFTSLRLSWGQLNDESIITLNQQIPRY